MKRLIACGIGLAFLLDSGVSAESEAEPEAVTIPLDQIWGYRLAGTKKVLELDPLPNGRDPSFKDAYSRSTLVKIVRYLSTYVPDGKAGPGFVVAGSGKEALDRAYSVFQEKAKHEKAKQPSIPRDTDLSLVFYAYTAGCPLEIESVEKSAGSISVKYRFVARDAIHGSNRFAIIPLGRLEEGTVQVDIEQIPTHDPKVAEVVQRVSAERLICDSFSFDVR
ncbi:MAG: hypothetical protein WD851_03720 [Pirellulales bacterium]